MVFLALCAFFAREGATQPTPPASKDSSARAIGIIDFYGLNRLSAERLRRAVNVKQGTPVKPDGSASLRSGIERRVTSVAGVERAQATLVCCENDRLILYVGVQESGAAGTPSRPAPTGAVRLDADIVQAGLELDRAISAAVLRGNASEDDSEGHSLARDPAIRAVQEHFIAYADQHVLELRAVLRDCADAKQRALAAAVIGYVTDKQAVVEDLVYAMSDPDSGTRNNAMRTLAVFTFTVPTATRRVPRVPYEPFVALLSSLDWTDRNKASVALMGLSSHRDPALLSEVREHALAALVEMARWKALGHAGPALQILGRVAGLSEQDLREAVLRNEREAIIRAALATK
jgi:hypothetical protein